MNDRVAEVRFESGSSAADLSALGTVGTAAAINLLIATHRLIINELILTIQAAVPTEP